MMSTMAHLAKRATLSKTGRTNILSCLDSNLFQAKFGASLSTKVHFKKLVGNEDEHFKSEGRSQPSYGQIKIINPQISFRYNFQPLNSDQQNQHETRRPLAIVMPWLLARDHQIEKYCQLYLKQGFDVLTVKSEPKDALIPKKGAQRTAEAMIDFFLNSGQVYEQIVGHGMSMGSYIYAEFLVKLMADHELLNTFGPRIKGLIFDSPIDVNYAAIGYATSFFPLNPLRRKLAYALFAAYFGLREKSVTSHHQRAMECLCDNHLKTPLLLLFSYQDPVSTLETSNRYMNSFKESGAEVYAKGWTDTEHVKHYAKYPQEYEEMVGNFLRRIGVK